MRVRRVDPIDHLARDGESLLLYAGELVRLGPIGTALFDACSAPVSVSELALQLERAFGTPAEGTLIDATLRAVEDLLSRGILVQPDTDHGVPLADATPEDRQETMAPPQVRQ